MYLVSSYNVETEQTEPLWPWKASQSFFLSSSLYIRERK